MNHGETLIEAFERHSARSPNKEAFVFLGDGAEETQRLGYALLRQRALGVAEVLRRGGLQGRPVMLAYPSGLEFVVGLLGCFYAGAIAVPVPFPGAKRARERIDPIVGDCRPGAILSTNEIVEDRRWPHDPGGPVRIPTDTIGAARPEAAGALPDAASIAFIQYSSGSTETPKGVTISHANLAHNQRMLASVYGHHAGSVGVNWVPAYHDMGLVGALLQTLYCGSTSILLPPLKVMQHPILWLRAISRYRGTSSTGPNFAYRLCVRATRPEERVGLDLRSWDVAICGGEPVDAATLEEFAAAFADAGFDKNAFLPAYGLAEGTLLATSPRKGEGSCTRLVDAARLGEGKAAPPGAGAPRRLVSCGQPHLGQRIVIVEPESRCPLPTGSIGEIWLAGESVAQGYWQNPAATQRDFRARIAGEAEGFYLRTGDLGFVGEEGLFVTGRLKEMLIIRGGNYYPQDLEDAVRRAHPLLENGQAAAFGIDLDDEEKLVVAIEPPLGDAKRIDGAAIEAAIAAISRGFGLKLYDLVVLRPGGLPRTTSGKVQRARCRALYLSGELPILGGIFVPFGLGRRAGAAADAESRLAPA